MNGCPRTQRKRPPILLQRIDGPKETPLGSTPGVPVNRPVTALVDFFREPLEQGFDPLHALFQ